MIKKIIIPCFLFLVFSPAYLNAKADVVAYSDKEVIAKLDELGKHHRQQAHQFTLCAKKLKKDKTTVRHKKIQELNKCFSVFVKATKSAHNKVIGFQNLLASQDRKKPSSKRKNNALQLSINGAFKIIRRNYEFLSRTYDKQLRLWGSSRPPRLRANLTNELKTRKAQDPASIHSF